MKRTAISTAVLLVGIIPAMIDNPNQTGMVVTFIILGWFLHGLAMTLIEEFCKPASEASQERSKT